MWTQTSTAPSRSKTGLDAVVEQSAASVRKADPETTAFLEQVAAENRARGLKPRKRAGLFSKLALAGAALASTFLPYTAQAAGVEYIIPVHAQAAGTNQSQWRSDERAMNAGSEAAVVTVVVHPRGRPAQPGDASYQVSVAPGDSFSLADVLAPVTGVNWLQVSSTQPLAWSTTYTYNQSADGTQQGQGYPVLLAEDARWAERGDKVIFVLPDTTKKRVNFGGLVRGQGTLSWTLSDTHSQLITGGSAGFTEQSFQYSPVSTALGGVQANTGDILTVTVGVDGGSSPIRAYLYLSVVDNLKPESQDPATDEGTIVRLLDRIEYRVLPDQGEVNDPYTERARVVSRTGTVVLTVGYDLNSDGTPEEVKQGNGTNTYDFQDSFTPLVAYTANPSLRVVVRDEEGHDFLRTTTGNSYTVTAEKDGYVATYEDAKAFIMANLDLVSNWAAHTTFGTQIYDAATWRAAWPKYFDGVTSPSNPEIQKIVFDDRGTSLAGNNTTLYIQNNITQTLFGMPEQEFDEFRTATKATLPN